MRNLDQSISDEIGKDFRPADGGESSNMHLNTMEHLFNEASMDK
jgi:hypothetical protein